MLSAVKGESLAGAVSTEGRSGGGIIELGALDFVSDAACGLFGSVGRGSPVI